jgi:hypothetical protein
MAVSRRRLAAIVAAAIVTAMACDTPTPTAPSVVVANLTGTWSGPASDTSGPGQMTWQITQEGSAFSGTLTLIETTANARGRGSVSGTLAGSAVTFTISVPAGGFDAPYQSCSSTASGTGRVTRSSIIGTYTGSSSCGGAIYSGQLSLVPQ